MLPRLVLIALQLGIGLWAGGWIADVIVRGLGARDLDVVIYAIVYAVVVWLVGLAGSGVLKGMRSPTAVTLALTFAGALVLGILLLIGPIHDAVGSIISFNHIPATVIPVIGAVLGYQIKG